ncbi:MAG: diguanylate cyclase [Rhodobacteraceae bacterium]|nr:diguanylate cyclase [Paracoccaceae bacterium]
MIQSGCTAFAPFGAMTFFALVLLAILALYLAWIRQSAPFLGKRYFMITVGGLIWWLAFVTLELWFLEPACKILAARLAYPGIAVVPPAWVLFVYCYALGRTDRLGAGRIALVFGGSVLISAAVLSNPWHELFYGPGTGPVSDEPGSPIRYEYGPLFLASATWLYLWLMAGVGMLVVGAFRTRELYRPHFLLLFVLTLVPIAGNVAHLLLGFSLGDFDPTPFLFACALLVYSWVISTEQLFDLGARARDVIFRQLRNPVVIVDSGGRLAGANPPARELFGLEGGVLPRALVELERKLRGGALRPEDSRTIAIAGRSWEVQSTAIDQPVAGMGGPLGRVLMLVDVTEMVQRQQMLQARLESLLERYNEAERAARQDSLTGLLNRSGLADAFDTALAESGARGLALAVIDLDRFKDVNDTHGHGAGDRVLVAFAEALKSGFRLEDLTFRIGGEEFVVLAPGLSPGRLAGRLDTVRDALALREVLPAEPGYRIGFSAGVVAIPREAATLEEALERADARLYEAKRAGRGRTHSHGAVA